MVARVATREEKNPLVDVLLEAVRLEIVALVVVELPTMRLVMVARVATREEMKELVLVALLEVSPTKLPFVVKKLLIVPVAAKKLEVLAFINRELFAIRLVTVVVAKVLVPVTPNVPEVV
jgi:hypothetical protein